MLGLGRFIFGGFGCTFLGFGYGLLGDLGFVLGWGFGFWMLGCLLGVICCCIGSYWVVI